MLFKSLTKLAHQVLHDFITHFHLDMPRQLLYWLDQETKTIFRVNLEGHHRKTVVESNGYLDRPFGLAVFEVKQPNRSSL